MELGIWDLELGEKPNELQKAFVLSEFTPKSKFLLQNLIYQKPHDLPSPSSRIFLQERIMAHVII